MQRFDSLLESTVKHNDYLMLPNLSEDQSLRDFFEIVGQTELPFYVSLPLMSLEGSVTGSLFVSNTKAHELNETQQYLLFVPERQVGGNFEQFRRDKTLKNINLLSEFTCGNVHSRALHCQSDIGNVKDVIFQIVADGYWLFLNKAWTEITCFSVEKSLGKFSLHYLYPPDREMINNQTDWLIRQEVRFLTKKGSFCWLEHRRTQMVK